MAVGALSIHKPQTWISAWFVFSSLLVIWDTGYIFSRPHSFKDGFLFPIWAPYGKYEGVDLIYSRKAWEDKLGFTAAQASLNVVETILNFAYLGLAHFAEPRYLAVSPLVGFTAVVMTWSKTALYWLQDYLGGPNGWTYTGHNSNFDWWILFALPNGLWLIFPIIIAAFFGLEIAENLRSAAGVAGNPKGPSAGTRSRSKSGRKSIKSQ
ncbi:related to adiponectin receptor 1 [Ceraceosorus bombacis]|uniref:Related to adiponectin receptor 1 n=1 Tax=Ceraceosorus bombacis TaxID=401625 RepID=A0A0P1BPQ2_9BASI|nr:related to adiponectin receptor 1 [Ceraceosorus bombacis]